MHVQYGRSTAHGAIKEIINMTTLEQTLRNINNYTWVVTWVHDGDVYTEFFTDEETAREFITGMKVWNNE